VFPVISQSVSLAVGAAQGDHEGSRCGIAEVLPLVDLEYDLLQSELQLI